MARILQSQLYNSNFFLFATLAHAETTKEGEKVGSLFTHSLLYFARYFECVYLVTVDLPSTNLVLNRTEALRNMSSFKETITN